MIAATVGAAISCQKAMPNCASVMIAVQLQWQPFVAILLLSGQRLAPVMLPGKYQTAFGGFLYPTTASPGMTPATLRLPQYLRLTGILQSLNVSRQPHQRDLRQNVRNQPLLLTHQPSTIDALYQH